MCGSLIHLFLLFWFEAVIMVRPGFELINFPSYLINNISFSILKNLLLLSFFS